MSKYHAQKTKVDGIKFDSKAEARRYCELKILENAGAITDLELQPPFVCSVNGVVVCTYKADFSYYEKGEIRIEDVKGFATDVYVLKKKLVEAIYGVTITEVRYGR